MPITQTMSVFQPTVNTTRDVWRLLQRLKIPRETPLLIHSSFKGLSRQGYRAEEVLAAFVEYMAPGTLLMPTMSWRSVNPQNPIFDELSTPGITGILTELFRLQYATKRSLHPTHSVAGLGGCADVLLASHHLDQTPCSARSPWGLLDDYDAYVMLLGVEMDCCTLVHHVEETIAPDLYLQPFDQRERYLCRDRYGREIEVYTRRHKRLCRNFWQFEDKLADGGRLRHEMITGVPCRVFRAADMVEVITARLRTIPQGTIAQRGERSKLM